MITKYKRIIGYANVCSSMQDHIIKFKAYLKAFGLLREAEVLDQTLKDTSF